MAVAAIAVTVAVIAFAPALSAGFHSEDFSYLVLMRHTRSPWELVAGNAFFAYYYRATGLLVWWLSVELAGNDPWWHNLIDMMLFGGSAGLLAYFAARLTQESTAGLIAGVSFACLPIVSSTATWMSDRYDPLALIFSLCALLAFENALAGKRRAALWTALWLLLAITAKETAYLIAGCMLLRIAWSAWSTRTWKPSVVACVVAPVLGALALRVSTVESLESSLQLHGIAGPMATGIAAWWRRLPVAVFGFHAPALWVWVLSAAIAASMAVGMVGATGSRRREVAKLVLTGSVLVLGPSVIQWPVTGLVLTQDASLVFSLNLRFYYFAGAGLALLLGATWLALRTRFARLAFSLGVTCLCFIWLAYARENARNWSNDPVTQTGALLTFGKELGARTYPPGCRIFVSPESIPTHIRSRIDLVVKASAARDASILGCSVSAGTAPFTVFLEHNECRAEAWPNLTIELLPSGPAIEPHGRFCFMVFETLEGDDVHARRFDFRMDADGHATATEAAIPDVAPGGGKRVDYQKL